VGALPRPDVVIVRDFVVDPYQVRLDPGRQGLLRQPRGGVPVGAIQQDDARQVQDAITATLVQRINQMNLPAVANSTAARADNVLLLEGRIRLIDEGNRRQRTLVGLGAGKSQVTMAMQVSYQSAAAPLRLLQTFAADSDSGRAPGAAETLGVGAATQQLATAAVVTGGTHLAGEARRSGVDDDAARAAEQLAKDLRQTFQQLGWIPAE
jgi:hypothetical protein